MSKLSDQTYLLTEQYQNASNLNARIQLHARFSVNKYGWQLWIFDHLNLAPDSRILELGCGPADLWRKNLNRIPADWTITLSDFSPGMVAQAQKNLHDSPRPFEFEIIDAQSIPYDNQTFDVVLANHMLYHVPDKAQALAEMQRVLKPGGRFYGTTVGKDHLKELDELVNKFASNVELLFDADHMNPFVLENGAKLLAPWFSEITAHHYKDALVITEVKPLVDYVLSTASKSGLVRDDLAEFTQFVEQEMAQRGAIHVTKASGLFEAFRN